MFRRRETMIALRARQQSFRVASDLGQPHMEPPVQPQRALPLLPPPPPIPDWWEPAEPHTPLRRYIHYDVSPFAADSPPPPSPLTRTLTSDVVLSVAAILIGFAVILMCKYG